MSNDKTIKAMRAALATTISRCHSSVNTDYKYYGGRGITVCKRWRDSFDNFLADMGVRPPGMTLERKHNSRGYCKSNCKWATRLEQAQNQRSNRLVVWRGQQQTVAAWERELGFKAGTLKARLLLGYTIADAFSKPVQYGLRVPGRQYRSRKKIDPTTLRRGLDHSLTKLTRADLARYRKRWRNGATFSALALEAGVSVTTMSNACQALGSYKGT